MGIPVDDRLGSTIKADAEAIKETPEEPDQLSKDALEELKKDEYKAHIKGLEQDIEARKTYAGRIYWFLVTWSIVLGAILVMCGIGWLDLSDKVLITLLSGTTIEIVGLFAIVILYLFPTKKR